MAASGALVPLDTHKYGYMVTWMKTTIEIPDDLLFAAKKRAAELRRPLRQLVEDGLRQQLAASNGGRRAGKKKFRWVAAKGGLPPGVDVSDRVSLHDWLRART
jgi:hypothetical protein